MTVGVRNEDDKKERKDDLILEGILLIALTFLERRSTTLVLQ